MFQQRFISSSLCPYSSLREHEPSIMLSGKAQQLLPLHSFFLLLFNENILKFSPNFKSNKEQMQVIQKCRKAKEKLKIKKRHHGCDDYSNITPLRPWYITTKSYNIFCLYFLFSVIVIFITHFNKHSSTSLKWLHMLVHYMDIIQLLNQSIIIRDLDFHFLLLLIMSAHSFLFFDILTFFFKYEYQVKEK